MQHGFQAYCINRNALGILARIIRYEMIEVLVFAPLIKIFGPRKINRRIAGDIDDPGGQAPLGSIILFYMLPNFDKGILKQVAGVIFVSDNAMNYAIKQ